MPPPRPRSVLKLQPMVDHNGPIMVPAGVDTFKSIGRPRGGGEGSVSTGMAEWRDLYDKMFPGGWCWGDEEGHGVGGVHGSNGEQ